MSAPTLVPLVIDGRPIEVAPGTNVVDAADGLGIEIPIFCHHPRLEPVGMCRMCLVEVGRPRVDRATGEVVKGDDGAPVIDFAPKPVAGCTTFVSPGMEVRTATETVALAREGVLEFLLTSHPLDCPVCDKGGECPLQNLTLRYGPGRSRFAWSEKFRFPKPVPVGPLIALDRERCVLCARCIRFQDEVAGDPVLDFENRGRGMEIVSVSDPPFASVFSGNTTDVCPVGALTTKDFRFEARAWEVVGRPGVCVHCPVGCNLSYDVRAGRVARVMPRENDAVNEIWLCDKGRFAHHFATHPERLTTPLVREGGELVPASWAVALERAHEGLAAAVAAHGPSGVGGIAGDSLANEDLYLFGRLFRGVLGSNNVDHVQGILRDDIVLRAGIGAEVRLTELGRGTTILVVGLDLAEEAPVAYLNLHKAVRHGAQVVVVAGRPQKLDADAAVTLRWRYGAEATLVAGLVRAALAERPDLDDAARARLKALAAFTPARVGKEHPVRAEDLAEAARLVTTADRVVVLYGVEAARLGLDAGMAGLTLSLDPAGEAGGGLVAVGSGANSQGAADMGVLPDWLPGYQSVADDAARGRLAGIWPHEPPTTAGLDARRMLAGGVRALYLMGADPVGDGLVAAGDLRTRDFVVVQDLFLTATAAAADVVLPAASCLERDGTMTSCLRRVQRFEQALMPAGEARPDWEILRDLGALFGAAEPYDCAADVFAELGRVVPAYAGLDYDALGAGAPPTPGEILLPFAPQTSAREVQYQGTAYTNTLGEGRVWSAPRGGAERPWRPADAGASVELRLVAAPRLYDHGTRFGASAVMQPLVEEAAVELSAFDAHPRGLFDGMEVTVASAFGSLAGPVRVLAGQTPGLVVVAAGGGWDTPPGALLGGAVSVPVTVARAGAGEGP